jgi:hypothetical protein
LDESMTGNAISVQAFARLGSSLSVGEMGLHVGGGMMSTNGSCRVFESASIGGFAEFGLSLSSRARVRLGASLSGFNEALLGSSLSLRALARVGSGVSVFGDSRVSAAFSVAAECSFGSSLLVQQSVFIGPDGLSSAGGLIGQGFY